MEFQASLDQFKQTMMAQLLTLDTLVSQLLQQPYIFRMKNLKLIGVSKPWDIFPYRN